MNSKKANWLFLTLIIVHLAVMAVIFIMGERLHIGMVANVILSEMILLVPALIFLLPDRKKWNESLGFHRMKGTTVLMTVVFTWLSMPLTTLVNAISMLFVENAVLEMNQDILGVSFPVMFLLMAVYGPFCEEVVFRGVIFRGYRRSGGRMAAVVLSALLFGLIHMNFNQAPYAFVIGILLALLVEATGSLWSSVLYHIIFNAQSVAMLFLYDTFFPGILDTQAEGMTNGQMMISIGVYAIIALAATSAAVCLLVWMAKREGRKQQFAQLFRKAEQPGTAMVTIPLILGAVVCLGIMLLLLQPA